MNPHGLDAQKQHTVCVTSLKGRKLLRSESLIIWSLICEGSFDGPALGFSHTKKFFWALSIPDSKVKQRPRAGKSYILIPGQMLFPLLAIGELVPPTTFPSAMQKSIISLSHLRAERLN